MAKLSAVAAVAALALSGCQIHPGAAAVVGSDRISDAQVDALARGLCSANITGAKAQGQPVPELASRGARQGALQVLLDSALSIQFGHSQHVTPDESVVSQALTQNEQGLAMLPASQRADFTAALKQYAEGQTILIAVGRKALQAQGQTNVADQQALAEGQRLRAQYVKHVTVQVDPRYGTWSNGSLQAGASSLSVPVSARAKAGAASNPGASFVSQLPASQKCS